MQEIWVGSLIREDPTCLGATEATEACGPQLLSLGAPDTEYTCPRAHALQQENHSNEKPSLQLESSPHSSQLEKKPGQRQGSSIAPNNLKKKRERE